MAVFITGRVQAYNINEYLKKILINRMETFEFIFEINSILFPTRIFPFGNIAFDSIIFDLSKVCGTSSALRTTMSTRLPRSY